MASNLTQRVAFAVIAIPLALGVVYLGGWALVAVVAIAAHLGARELLHFSVTRGGRPLRRTALLSATAVPVLMYLQLTAVPLPLNEFGLIASLWLIAVLTIALFRRGPDQQPLGAVAVTVLAVAYPAGLASFLLSIRHGTMPTQSWAGAWLVFMPLVVTWICDTAAMFGGRAFGGKKLWPSVSPGKTWSGSFAGVVAAMATVPLLNVVILERLGVALPLIEGLLFGLVLGIIGQVGDLVESLFKREAGLKDSSALIPGHGGVLDRFDSLYFILPVATALYHCFGVL